MPTIAEIAAAQEARKLRLAGLNPDGTPIEKADDQPDDANDQPDDADDQPDDADDQKPDQESELRKRIAQLERERDAALGRLVPAQQESETARRLWLEAQRDRDEQVARMQAEIQALQSQSKPAEIDLSEILSEEEIADLDPVALKAMQKIARAQAERLVPKIDTKAEVLKTLNERELEKVEKHRNMVLTEPSRGLHKLSQLLSDSDFQEWYQQEDNILDSVMNSLVSAKTTEAVDRYAKAAAKKLQEFYSRNRPSTDPKTSLERHARREAPKKLSVDDVKAKLAEANRLTRAGKHKEAKAIYDEVDNLT